MNLHFTVTLRPDTFILLDTVGHCCTLHLSTAPFSLSLLSLSLRQRIVVQKSFLISADVAHAIHPNYAHKHESKHAPRLNMGTVIKTNDNQRYATNSVTGFMIRELARAKDVPVQEFVVRHKPRHKLRVKVVFATETYIRCWLKTIHV